MNGLGAGERTGGVNGVDRAEGRQQVVGKGEEEVADACEEPPWRNWVTASESQTAAPVVQLSRQIQESATSVCPPRRLTDL